MMVLSTQTRQESYHKQIKEKIPLTFFYLKILYIDEVIISNMGSKILVE
jgi:hypothetical protein